MEIKFRNVVSFRTEDTKFPAANLLRGGKWLNERKSRSSVNDVTLCFEGAYSISHIDVGNWGSSFITIEVSQVSQQGYQTLLPSTELMSGRDAQAKKNWASVHMFSKENFVEDVLERKWNLVRVTCLQPFLQNEQFGLSFIKIFSIPEDEIHLQPAPQLPPPGSVFQMMRDCTLGKASPVVVNRSQQLVLAAIEKQRTSMKCSSDLKEATEASSNGKESSPGKIDLPLRKTNERTNTLSGSARKNLYNSKNFQNSALKSQSNPQTTHKSFSPSSRESNKSIESLSGRQSHQAQRSSSSVIRNQKHTPSSDALFNGINGPGKSVGTLRKKQRTSPLSPSGFVNNMKSPVPKAASMRKQWSSGKELKLLQKQVNSSHGGHKDEEISDITVISDSDSESPIAVSPLASISTNRKLINCDSDTETIIDLSLDQPHNEMYANKEVVSLSSPELLSSDILLLGTEAVPGPSGIACPLCSDYFDASSIEQHAATCGLSSGTEELICPICSRFFPPDILPQHADLCAERSRK